MRSSIYRRIIEMIFPLFLISFFLFPNEALATSQWAKKFNLSCQTCHTVFPRLNSYGEQFLRNGYQLESTYKSNPDDQYSINADGVFLNNLSNLFGVRINFTPFLLETNSFQKDATSSKTSKITFSNPNWIQTFAAGSLFKDVSFFTEMQYNESSFHFSWYYLNFTNIGGTSAFNIQVGSLSPMQFTSYPNRLRMFAAIKNMSMDIKSSNGLGESSVNMSSARKGIQYYGYGDVFTVYAGISPGSKAASIGQTLGYWGGITLRMPSTSSRDFEGSTLTLHYYGGTDTKNTGATSVRQLENKYTRFSPQVTIRYNDKLDLQAAYVIAKDDNWYLVASPTSDFNYEGIGIAARYMIDDKWSCGIQYDKYDSDNQIAGVKVLDYNRLTPALTYILNGNMSVTAYYEANLLDLPTDTKVNKFYINLRAMF